MIEPYKSKATTGAKKAIGQLKKVLEMIEEDKYCMDTIQQIKAVNGLLRNVSSNVLESHLNTCAGKALNSKNKKERESVIKEIVKAFKTSEK